MHVTKMDTPQRCTVCGDAIAAGAMHVDTRTEVGKVEWFFSHAACCVICAEREAASQRIRGAQQ